MLLILLTVASASVQAATCKTVCAQQQDWIQSWVFNGRTETVVRESLQNQADQKLKQMEEACGLTAEQNSKLKLAATGDVNRFFHEVAQLRKATKDLNQQDQNTVQEAWTLISPLSTRLQAGLFDEKSLFAKVMSSTLDEAQANEYKKMLREQIERRHHALVLAMVSTLEKHVPMVGDQREKLIELLDAQPVKDVKQQGLEAFVGYAKLDRVPVKELEKLFDKDQLTVLNSLRERYAQIVQMFR